MKLKKKVIFGMVAGLFAVATVFNMSMLNENGAGDVSLDAVALMAQAQSGESAWESFTNSTEEWYDSKIYDCKRITEEIDDYEWGIGTYGDVKDKFDADWTITYGDEIDDDDWGAYYGKTGSHDETTIDCVGGRSVAHCWEC
jgi:hypothetical protein